MNSTYYADRRRSQDGYSTADYHRSVTTSPHRNGDYTVVTRDYHQRSPSRDVDRYDNRFHDYYNDRDYDRDYDSNHHEHHHHHGHEHDHHEHDHQRRHRSLSSSYPRQSQSHDRSMKSPERHHTGKDLAATILGGVVGGQAGRRISGEHSKLATVAGVLIGAYGGHELEKGWEHHEHREKERERRQSMSSGYYSR